MTTHIYVDIDIFSNSVPNNVKLAELAILVIMVHVPVSMHIPTGYTVQMLVSQNVLILILMCMFLLFRTKLLKANITSYLNTNPESKLESEFAGDAARTGALGVSGSSTQDQQ